MTATTDTAPLVAAAAAPAGWPRCVVGLSSNAPVDPVPPLHAALVPRPRLVRRLSRDPTARLALLVAPAGYGKTTLLTEFAHRDPRPFAWLNLSADDDDADRLSAAMARAVRDLPARGARVLVLDRAEFLHSPGALDVLRGTVGALGPGSLLALASRREPDLPLGSMRADRLVVQLGARDLAMNPVEAAALLARAGLDAPASEVVRLTEESEGWPVALYLAALSLAGGDDRPIRFAGDDRLLADYLRDELLSGLPEDKAAFVRRTSVLDRLSGPLCDAVLESEHSGTVLRDLARDNVLIEPLDPCDREFRYHPLFAAMLRGELRRREHGCEAVLHRRASAWHDRHHDPERAVTHAIASGDRARSAELLWRLAPAYAFGGRTWTLHAWLGALGDADIAASPRLALSACTFHLARGDRYAAEHWLRAAELRSDEAGEDLDRLAGARTVLRAALTPLRAAPLPDARAVAGDSALLALGHLAGGVGRHLAGDRVGAAALLHDGARVGAVTAPVVRALCLAQLGILAAETEDWEEVALHAGHADAVMETADARDDPLVALVHAVSAVAAAHCGNPEAARRSMRTAKRLLDASTAPIAWLGVQARIWLARTAVRLSDITDARMLLAQAARLRRDVQDSAVLEGWIADAWDRADAFAAGETGVTPMLTTAELRILRFLPSHLSFREIGDRLDVSANTVKTQALAVYRKLDVSSRSGAVLRGREFGLVDG